MVRSAPPCRAALDLSPVRRPVWQYHGHSGDGLNAALSEQRASTPCLTNSPEPVCDGHRRAQVSRDHLTPSSALSIPTTDPVADQSPGARHRCWGVRATQRLHQCHDDLWAFSIVYHSLPRNAAHEPVLYLLGGNNMFHDESSDKNIIKKQSISQE